MSDAAAIGPLDSAQTRCGRLRLDVRGAVQGVGFRPHVHRLATELRLAGFVSNSSAGVLIEVEGDSERLRAFLSRLEQERPVHCFLDEVEPTWLDSAGYHGFEIRRSTRSGEINALVLPDIATCPECLAEVMDPANRRHRYPFTNCTHCGPRFTIIESVPYDRSSTSMCEFTMCPACEAEYHDPAHRRFHAQPNACPDCGPQLAFWDAGGQLITTRDDALLACAAAIVEGRIAAVKGLGGYHLMADATNDAAVRRLRSLKRREEKPFALMFPSIAAVREACETSALEERQLCSSEAPIVLLRRKKGAVTAPSVAPGNPYLGALLPMTALHHLLLREVARPVVATSGNTSEEPICFEERDLLQRLGGIADVFLVHNRRIVRHVDDSIVRIMLGREMILRRGRGYAPFPVKAPAFHGQRAPILATGAHLKNSIALCIGPQVFLSQHVGDLETAEAVCAFERVTTDLQRLHGTRAEQVACDSHRDYLSTQWAHRQPIAPFPVQHHYAHVLSCMTENELAPPALGVAWDGTGQGLDGTIWGGEFLLIQEHGFERFASLRTFPLPGGDAAAREPRRAAFGLLHAFGLSPSQLEAIPTLQSFSVNDALVMSQMIARGVNAPRTSSIGRLFDAVASIAGIRQRSRFEGQAAMELEFATADAGMDNRAYGFALKPSRAFGDPPSQHPQWIIDWSPMVAELLADVRHGVAAACIAVKFHNTLAAMVVKVAQRSGQSRIALSGGCFQNRELVERVARGLESAGLRPYWHCHVPPNDGGIALGQIAAALKDPNPT